MQLECSTDAYGSSCLILSTDCLNAVDFDMFTHDGSHPSTLFTGVNTPFTAGMSIVAWRNFPMTERNVLKYTLPLWLIVI